MFCDPCLLNTLQHTLRHDVLDVIMIGFTYLGEYGALWFAMAFGFLIFKPTRKWGVFMLAAIALEVLIVNFGLKPLVARPRPFEVNPYVQLAIAKPSGYSFPSGHAAVSFAAAYALHYVGAKKWLVVSSITLATIIAFSRIYLYVHYPSDIIIGAMIGMFSAWVAMLGLNFLIARFMTQRNT